MLKPLSPCLSPGAMRLFLIVLLLLIVDRTTSAASPSNSNQTIEQIIRDDPDLSQFYSLLESNKVANITLTYRQATIFAPTNQAFQTFTIPDSLKDSLILYHMSNLPFSLENLGASVFSEMDGNPPLWVTRTETGEIFINNAKVLRDRSNIVRLNGNNQKQVLHKIDKVLDPIKSKPDSQLYNPDALMFLNQSENFELGTHRVRSFRQRVDLTNKSSVFRADGRHTFFIPVDEGFKPPPRPSKIDAKVIDGHIIPNHVLFTDATPKDHEFETLAFGDMIKVSVSFTSQSSDGKVGTVYVKSNTRVGDSQHTNGVVLAEIMEANIPVKNGVVHLIHRPLMVVDTTVEQFLKSFKDKTDGPLFKFYEVIMDAGGDFMNKITSLRDLTLFAPSNAAWQDPNVQNIINDKARLREILNLHLVEERLPVETIVSRNVDTARTVADRKSLYFGVIHGEHGNVTMTVEGGGVNASVVQANIAATNGIVHIIDRVLGVPYTTVKSKLATDPMLNKTYHLGELTGFNEELGEMNKRFTYFVPRDYAWKKAEVEFSSAYKKLFMPHYKYHGRQILERHLVVADRVYTMAELKRFGNESFTLPSLRDQLKLRLKESDQSYYIEWQGEWVTVYRPDVECTNGVIHVIDKVLFRERDVTVNAAPSSGALALFVPHLAMLLAARWLLS